MAAVSTSPAPVLEAAARQLAEATSPHPQIYEMSPGQGGALLDQLQAGQGVAKPEADEEWVSANAGEWGTVRALIMRPSGATGTLPVFMYIHGEAGCSATPTPTTSWSASWWSAPARRRCPRIRRGTRGEVPEPG